jgi:hypothetical protein
MSTKKARGSTKKARGSTKKARGEKARGGTKKARGSTKKARGEKARETRLRRMADLQGFKLVKSRVRDPKAAGYGRYVLVDIIHNAVTIPDSLGPTGQPNLTLDQIEELLATPRR